MRVPDPIEMGEASMERWADTHIEGNWFLCDGCGIRYRLDEAIQATPNPYSAPICCHCAFPVEAP